MDGGDTVKVFPDSVCDLAEWLEAHPWVTRIKADARTYRRYSEQLEPDAPFRETTLFTIRRKHAVIVAAGWPSRRELFPARVYRR